MMYTFPKELVTLLQAYLVLVLVIGFIVWLIQTIAMWKVFTKARQAGWKAIIPIYNTYIYFKIAGIPGLFWLTILLTVLAAIPNQIVLSISLILTIVITIYHAYKLSKAFGHGVGYTLGLLFLNTIFILILGFGSDEYKLEK